MVGQMKFNLVLFCALLLASYIVSKLFPDEGLKTTMLIASNLIVYLLIRKFVK